MKQKCIALLLLCALLLCGCAPKPLPGPSASIVRRIVATAEGREYFLRRYYDTDEKMEPILLALRSLYPNFTAQQDVENLHLPTLCITLICSDGSEKLYRLKDVRYLQLGTGVWKQVDSGKAADLWQLIWDTPDDPEQSRTFHHSLPRIQGRWHYPVPLPTAP